jgi:hypothetical protein
MNENSSTIVYEFATGHKVLLKFMQKRVYERIDAVNKSKKSRSSTNKPIVWIYYYVFIFHSVPSYKKTIENQEVHTIKSLLSDY